MTEEELRKIYDETEKEVCTPKLCEKIIANIENARRLPYEVPAEFSLLVNRVVDKEILIRLLSKLLDDK